MEDLTSVGDAPFSRIASPPFRPSGCFLRPFRDHLWKQAKIASLAALFYIVEKAAGDQFRVQRNHAPGAAALQPLSFLNDPQVEIRDATLFFAILHKHLAKLFQTRPCERTKKRQPLGSLSSPALWPFT